MARTSDERSCFVNVRHCFFDQVFRANGEQELTALLCLLDNVILGELAKPQYRVKFERPTVIGFGNDKCRFQFTRTEIA